MSSNAGSVTVVLSANTTSFSAAMTEAQKNLDKFGNAGKSASGHTVSGMQAASASIRLLENPLGNNIRAIERLLSQSKLLSGAMKAAFPLVGAIAIGSMIVKLGTEVVAFVEKVNATPKAIKNAFDALNLSARSTNDALDLTNAKLANEIATLEHKPENQLKVAIAETRVEADALAASTATAAKAVTDLLNQNKLGMLAQLMGKASTSSVSSSVQVFMNDLQALGNRLSIAAQKPGNDVEVNDLRKQIADKQNAGLSWSKSKLFVTDNPQFAVPDDDLAAGDQGANRNILLGFQGVMLGEQHHETSKAENKQLTGRKEADEAAKARADAAKAAAKAALEAAKAAAHEQLQQWESDNSDWKAEEDRSLREDAAWWSAKLKTLTLGSLNYRAVNKKINADIIMDNREYAAMIAKFQTEYLNDGNKRSWVSTEDTADINAQGKAVVEWITALRQGVDLQRENADAMAESSLQMALATGNMTKLDAAQAMANVHTAQYVAQMDALKDTRQSIVDNGSLTDMQRKAQLAQVDNAIVSVQVKRDIQAQQDHNATNPQGSSASVGFVDALDEFVHASKDAASQMRELASGTLASINSELLKAMTGQRTDWKGAASGVAKNIAAIGLQKAEGSVLSALGFGGSKADGTRANPLYVRIADSIAGAASTAASSTSGFISTLMHMIPGFAGGGAVSPGTLAMVGEHGPELAYFGSGANITPNHQLSNMTTGNGALSANYNLNVANGVTPEQMQMYVRSTLQEVHPQVVRASAASQRDQQSRRPLSASR